VYACADRGESIAYYVAMLFLIAYADRKFDVIYENEYGRKERREDTVL
jgi:hypothetical protein